MEIDPDYSFDQFAAHKPDEDSSRDLEIGACQAVKEKIRKIIKKEFAQEISAKEHEVAAINDLLTEARHLLDRLRACAVASYYASSFTKPVDSNKQGVENGAAQHPAIQVIPAESLRNLTKTLCFDESKCKSIDEINQDTPALQFKRTTFEKEEKGARCTECVDFLLRVALEDLIHLQLEKLITKVEEQRSH